MVLPFKQAPTSHCIVVMKALACFLFSGRIICNMIRTLGTSCSRGIQTYRIMAQTPAPLNEYSTVPQQVCQFTKLCREVSEEEEVPVGSRPKLGMVVRKTKARRP